MSTLYEKRWNRAKEIAQDIKDRYSKALKTFGKECIFTYDGEIVKGDIVIHDDQIILHEENVNFILFIHDPEMDNGSHWKMNEIKEQFDRIKIYVPYR